MSVPVDVEGFRTAVEKARRVWMDENPCEDGHDHVTPFDQFLYGALAQQPASVGEEIMVNAAHDVFVLPLQPSGLSSGPRFVVHVPKTEAQPPAAVDEEAIRAFEEHFQASSDDPYFERELELWLTAWRKALAAQQQGGAA